LAWIMVATLHATLKEIQFCFEINSGLRTY
jgi:hypothetical protein